MILGPLGVHMLKTLTSRLCMRVEDLGFRVLLLQQGFGLVQLVWGIRG